VAEAGGDSPYRDACGEHLGRREVAAVVKANAFDAELVAETDEPGCDAVRTPRSFGIKRIAEDEGRLSQRRSEGFRSSRQRLPAKGQKGQGRLVERDSAHRVRLGRLLHQRILVTPDH
jgi:hypothetical protein